MTKQDSRVSAGDLVAETISHSILQYSSTQSSSYLPLCSSAQLNSIEIPRDVQCRYHHPASTPRFSTAFRSLSTFSESCVRYSEVIANSTQKEYHVFQPTHPYLITDAAFGASVSSAGCAAVLKGVYIPSRMFCAKTPQPVTLLTVLSENEILILLCFKEPIQVVDTIPVPEFERIRHNGTFLAPPIDSKLPPAPQRPLALVLYGATLRALVPQKKAAA